MVVDLGISCCFLAPRVSLTKFRRGTHLGAKNSQPRSPLAYVQELQAEERHLLPTQQQTLNLVRLSPAPLPLKQGIRLSRKHLGREKTALILNLQTAVAKYRLFQRRKNA